MWPSSRKYKKEYNYNCRSVRTNNHTIRAWYHHHSHNSGRMSYLLHGAGSFL